MVMTARAMSSGMVGFQAGESGGEGSVMPEIPEKHDERQTKRGSDDEPQDEPGAQERFDRGLRWALATPPKRHKTPKPKSGVTILTVYGDGLVAIESD
jgi:hypothetical protein